MLFWISKKSTQAVFCAFEDPALSWECPTASDLLVVKLMKLAFVARHTLRFNAACLENYSVHSFIWGSICAFPLIALLPYHWAWCALLLGTAGLHISAHTVAHLHQPRFARLIQIAHYRVAPFPIMVSIYSIITVIFYHYNAINWQISLRISNCRGDH